VKEGKESRRGGGLPWVFGKELERKGENLFGRKKKRGRRVLVICLSFFFSQPMTSTSLLIKVTVESVVKLVNVKTKFYDI
jgi:hypothetical protein